jgi:hypothetical protein
MRRVNEWKVEMKQVSETHEEGNGVHESLFRSKLQKGIREERDYGIVLKKTQRMPTNQARQSWR